MQNFVFAANWISKKITKRLSSIFQFQFLKELFELKASEAFNLILFIQSEKHHMCKRELNQELMQAWLLIIQVIEDYDWSRTVVVSFFLE